MMADKKEIPFKEEIEEKVDEWASFCAHGQGA
jgi:hypothetical protein